MSNMYLQKESYYADSYDLWTIQECLRAIEFWDKRSKEKDVPGKEQVIYLGRNFQLNTIKGERYKERASFIRDWMGKDRKRDERVETAKEPQNIRCPNCYEKMHVTLKDLYTPDEFLGVIFFGSSDFVVQEKQCFIDANRSLKTWHVRESPATFLIRWPR